MSIILERYYIDVLYNNKVILTTLLFDTEEKALKWWKEVYLADEHTKVYLSKEMLYPNYSVIDEVIRELNVD